MSSKTALAVKPASLPAKGTKLTLALGGGAARGIGHIPMLEVLDELGLKPDLIVGTSMGSIMGASYAAGMTGREIREYSIDLLKSRTNLLKRVINDWPGSLTDIWNPFTPSMFNPVTLFEILLPDPIKNRIEDLQIPFEVVTTDFYTHEQRVIKKGPVVPAIAASSALPALFKPVEIDGAVLIDGGFVNPTPFDLIERPGAITIAIDVTGDTGTRKGDEWPSSIEAWVGASQIMLHSITREKLKYMSPDILIRPDVGNYGALEFHKIEEILKSCEPAKEKLKRALTNKLETRSLSMKSQSF